MLLGWRGDDSAEMNGRLNERTWKGASVVRKYLWMQVLKLYKQKRETAGGGTLLSGESSGAKTS